MVIGSPERIGERAMKPEKSLIAAGLAALVMKLGLIASFGQSCQR